ncbi:hypothetical protein BCR36DRAFT_583470 [Piromyces finnis]|uniref:Chromo domain-containing protein n=1 Tax=Piromyces finnis TaxID=1754191 RepID=A0A1Y1V987_9FUNG|nr:hypothetical protein BCR36DRAFT_583470 [Piromyces finnis]|eukprot:ORX50348.1 hypothetical protein BCR36DRAFT_583470 [Piromyces finnis]
MSNKRQTRGKKKEENVEEKEIINPDKVEEVEEEYNVEKILDVKVEKGQKFFLIKWEGYSSDDNTWERESDCECKELIEEFYNQRNDKQKNKKKEKTSKKEAIKVEDSTEDKNNKKRKSPESSESKSKQRKANKSKDDSNELKKKQANEKIDINKSKSEDKIEFYKYYVPEDKLPYSKMSRDSWENLIDCIESIEESDEPLTKKDKNDIIKLKVYVRWKDGVRSVHTNHITNNKCPKKMIEFYENHIRFLRNQNNSN